ncbi:MAG: molybdate ABC transporter substrate-binding protein [Lachnospiraceae bacterium]|nr:molybdate ABC transporter substrate-binding protein [Lachnospiraceae bacterium]
MKKSLAEIKGMIKKPVSVLLVACLVLSTLTGCSKKEEEKAELIVFAAASMTETLNSIAELYKKKAPDVTLTFNFDSSGTLKTQIAEGADCDVFISAAPKQMNQLDASKDADGGNTDGLDFVMQGTRFNLLENKVALAVPDGNPANITSYEDLAARLSAGTVMLAMGNSDVSVGQYTQKIFKYFNLDETALSNAGVLTYGSNVKEVTTQIKEGTVDCGIIYGTDAFSAGLTVIATATADMCGQVIYPAAVMKNTKNKKAAKDFLEYLKSSEASDVFIAVGFSPLN